MICPTCQGRIYNPGEWGSDEPCSCLGERGKTYRMPMPRNTVGRFAARVQQWALATLPTLYGIDPQRAEGLQKLMMEAREIEKANPE